MRNWDNWNRYLDNHNNPLHGCIQIMVKDGNTIAPIFDSDSVALQNPQITDAYGRTHHQVFIDTDVVAYFYKYIGSGIWNTQLDIDTSDITKWALQYTSENINDVLKHITSDSAMCVGTIADLRNLDVTDVPDVCGYKVITLLGYDSVGDKEPVNYIWNPSLTDNDDNGSVIQGTDLTGRWVMVKPTEHCDSRHFGIFPQNTTNFNGDTARMQQWIGYCNAVNLRPYFSANGDYKFYKYNNLTFTIPYIDIAKDVTFLDYGTSNIWTTEFNGNPYFYNHATNVNSKEVKTSWGAYIFVNPKHVIVDNNDLFFNTTLSNCTVDINVPCDKVCSFTNATVNINASFSSISAFSNCIINSKNMITAGCHFANCKLTEDMFYGSPYIHVDGNCIADFNDFEHKELMWLRIKEQQQQINYDWEGKLTQQNPWEGVVDTDRWLLNYKSANADAVLKESDNPHTYYIENCAGSLTLEGKAANTYIIKDSELVLKFADGYNTGCTIKAQDSTLNISQDRINLYLLNLQDSNIISSGNNGSIDATYVNSYNSTLNVPLYCGYGDVKDSNIADNIQVYGIDQQDEITVDTDPSATGTHTVYQVNRVIAGNFVNNFVNGSIEIGTVNYDSDPHFNALDLVRGLTIKDNVGISAEPIVVHRSFSSIYDDYNTYTYQGNTGTMEMRTNDIVGTIHTNGGDEPHYSKMWNQIGVYGITNTTANPNSYLFLANFFTIGTRNVKVMMRVEYSGLVAGFGADVGVTAPLRSEGKYEGDAQYYTKSMTKSAGGQFEWMVQNTPITVGMAGQMEGEQIKFNVVQI